MNECYGVGALGVYHQERGELTEAEKLFERGRRLSEQLGTARDASLMLFRLASAYDEGGQLAKAGTAYYRALDLVKRGNVDARYEALYLLGLGGFVARAGNLDEASEHLREARMILSRLGPTGFELLPDLQEAQILLEEARRAHARADHDGATEMRREATERIDRAKETPRGDGDGAPRGPLLRWSPEARMFVRLIERELKHPHGNRPLRIRSDGSAFEWGGPSRPVPPGSPTLRRVLAELLALRLKKPGEVLPTSTILERCWRDERMLPDAGAHRVREVIRRLRRIGLEGVLRTGAGGYFLDPSAGIEVLPGTEAAPASSDVA